MTQKGRGHACAPIVLLSYEDKRDQLVPLDKVWHTDSMGFLTAKALGEGCEWVWRVHHC